MALGHSTGAQNALLASGIATMFDTNGRIAWYTGTQPSPDAAATGTLLATTTLPADAMGTASSGSIAFNTISNVTAVASGTVGCFCIYLSTETALTSVAGATDKRIWGSVTATAGGGDATFDVIAWATNGTVAITSLSYGAPS